MKVLFIYPNLNAQVGFNYGVAFLSACLRQAGHSTALLNINDQVGFGFDLKRVRGEVEAFRPDLIGFSVVTNQYRAARDIARDIKGYCTIPIVCGGIHPTLDPEGVLREECFDYVCGGEGERAIVELADAIERNAPATEIENIWSKSNGTVIRNRVRPFVPLESLPRKDYSIFDFQKMIDVKDGWVGIMTSRGCPFNCSYCFNHRLRELYQHDLGCPASRLNYIRHHPVNEVIEEIGMLLASYRNITTIIFDDDLFTLNKEYLRDFCEEYRKRVAIPFVCNAHVKAFDEEVAAYLKDAGCRIVKFGLESGSERVRREILNRRMSNDDIAEAFALAERHGFHTSAFVMLGFPHETISDVYETIDLLARIKPGRFRWSLFFPYPNTRAYDIAHEGGFLDFRKLEELTNFTDESALDFGPDHNVFLRRLKITFPWHVNARAGFSCSELFDRLIEHVDKIDPEDWPAAEKLMLGLDENISGALILSRERHYSYKYNLFTAVRSY
ncbi:MAG: radical SAM protein [Candidatus Abyssobacteria bacterium SURF_17]|jgi:radical SAM superfamily enzyme YgiQ (UPF0313 family)|uniref:Radical SAM protein n=1 Tax=Candidatus Abyssobacteria bacterium SURF_17 TaxID=2093361 RepID=A0A419F1F0_9BACT|nr:MAG: radical SAM protein [Candidatus Abyssubacteria bacterium SURF_17]